MVPNQKMIQQLQAKMMKIQEDLGNETVEASVGGVVTIVMTGHHEVKSVKIDPAAVDPDDVEMLEDTLVTAFNQGLEKASALAQERMGAITGGMKIPGLF
ncbi:MAG TPA: YbaB/EbfC family nucleoid-associated protein [Chloroflexia bacterium]|nr:YbaB/EbfC family nucleoid-associated protein [Chloroflexia bacterium]